MKWEHELEQIIELAEMALESSNTELATFGTRAAWFGYDDERFDSPDEVVAFMSAERDLLDEGIWLTALQESL